ncbi:PIG-L deacetylase family protein [Dermacoccaceae bacterium W4C1]
MTYTLVAFHAHPDDEALLTSGTMARAAAQGHRVVLVVATDGAQGLAAAEYTADGSLATHRRAELQTSAEVLGVARVCWLGYADSGMEGEPAAGDAAFVNADLEAAAGRLAAILTEESADVLLTYDPAGGYGHRDHVRAHEVGYRAAELAGTPRVLEATVPRDLLVRVLRLLTKVYPFPPEFDLGSFERAFSAADEITHRVSVRRYIAQKKASMRAHASQASADGGADRTLGALVRIPRPIYDLAFGREWFIDRSHRGERSDDVFAGLS